MESEELNLMQMLKNLYQKRKILVKILIIVSVLALAYTLINDVLIKETTAVVLIDKADSSIEDTITSLNTKKVKATFDKSKKTITYASSGIDSLNCEMQVEYQMNIVRDKLADTYSISLYKSVQDIKTEDICISKIIKDIVLFEVIGIVLYCGYIFIITSLSTTTDEYIIQNVTKLKVLGKLYKPNEKKKENKFISKFIIPDDNISIEKQLRIIKTNIELKKDNEEPRTILFTNANKRVRCDEVIKLLAKEYSMEQKRIMILAYDIEKYENVNISNVNVMKLSDNDSTKKEAEALIEELSTKFDMILIDGENVNENHLSIIFSNIVDSNIIIALMEKTKIEDIIKVKQYIEDVNGKISGIILNKI